MFLRAPATNVAHPASWFIARRPSRLMRPLISKAWPAAPASEGRGRIVRSPAGLRAAPTAIVSSPTIRAADSRRRGARDPLAPRGARALSAGHRGAALGGLPAAADPA